MDLFADYFNRHIDLSAADRSPWVIGVAIVQTLIGFVYLLWGWRVFNIVVMLQAALMGAIAGTLCGAAAAEYFGLGGVAMIGCVVGGALVLGAIFVLLAKLLVRYIFALQAGLAAAGVLLLALESASVSIPPIVAMIAAVVLLLVTAVWACRKFAAAVMAMMSLQGAVFAVAGASMLVAAVLESRKAVTPLMALIAVAVLAVPSFLYQRSRGQVMGQTATGGKSSRPSLPAARRKAA